MAFRRDILAGPIRNPLPRNRLAAYRLPEGGAAWSDMSCSILRLTIDIEESNNESPRKAAPIPRRRFPILPLSVLAGRLLRRYGVPTHHHAHRRSHRHSRASAPRPGQGFVLSDRELAILDALLWYKRHCRLRPTRADLARALNLRHPEDIVLALASLRRLGLIARHPSVKDPSRLVPRQHIGRYHTSFFSLVPPPKGPPGYRYRLAWGAFHEDRDWGTHPLNPFLSRTRTYRKIGSLGRVDPPLRETL